MQSEQIIHANHATQCLVIYLRHCNVVPQLKWLGYCSAKWFIIFELIFVRESTVFMLSFGNYNLHLHHTQNELKTSYQGVNRFKWKRIQKFTLWTANHYKLISYNYMFLCSVSLTYSYYTPASILPHLLPLWTFLPHLESLSVMSTVTRWVFSPWFKPVVAITSLCPHDSSISLLLIGCCYRWWRLMQMDSSDSHEYFMCICWFTASSAFL